MEKHVLVMFCAAVPFGNAAAQCARPLAVEILPDIKDNREKWWGFTRVRLVEKEDIVLYLSKGLSRSSSIQNSTGSIVRDFWFERWQIFQDVWDVPGGLLFHFVKMEGPASGDLYIFVEDRAAYASTLFVRRNTEWTAGLYDSWSTVRCAAGQPLVYIRPVLWPPLNDQWPPRYGGPRRYAPISCTLTGGSFACRYPEEPAPVREWSIGIRQWAVVDNRQPF